MVMAANWDGFGEHNNNTSGHTVTTPIEAVWQLIIIIVAATGITKVELPVFKRDAPISGTKEGRQSFLKLLTGMNNDVSPLNFRGEYKHNSNEKDPYYNFAPEWSTLSGGNNPSIVVTPLKICEDCISTAQCVPMVMNDVLIRILEPDGTQTNATIDDVRTRNIPVQKVPRLTPSAQNTPTRSPAGSSSNSTAPSSPGDADILRSQVAAQATQMTALESQIEELKALLRNNATATSPQPAEPVTAVPTTADTPANHTAPNMSKRAAGKRPRRI